LGIGGFFLGLSRCATPEDGNPVGFHLTGEARVKPNSSLDLTKCTSTCGVRFEFHLVKQGTSNTYPSPRCDPSKPCFEFTDSTPMLVGSTDDAIKHEEERVTVSGVVELTSLRK
jgi:hypothetical protein